MIKTKEASEKFSFSFWGAMLKALDMAEKMNIRQENSAVYAKEGMLDRVFSRIVNSIINNLERKDKGEDLRIFYVLRATGLGITSL